MHRTTPAADRPARARFADLYMPKLITVLREGYGLGDLRTDAVAGLTVAVVALPLSMAIAIACGLTPDRGLYAAIVGGFLVSLLGGSRFQIGGPAGAFIVLVATTVAQHGVDGMLLATFISGLILLAIGLLRLGTYIRFIPFPVTVGFTAGIAVIIFSSQVKDLLGLTLGTTEPPEFIEKWHALWQASGTLNAIAVLVAVLSIGIIVGLRMLRPKWPGMLVAVGVTSLLVALLNLPVETIGTRFGGLPNALPMPALPEFSVEKILAVLPNAISFALLGAIESLLSAVVADGMTGRRHRSNSELVAQGVANIGGAIFGAMPITGTIARTATNIRAGARGPISGMIHSLSLLLFMLVAAPLASYIPLAALAGILVVVAWNMVERHQFISLLRASPGDALVLLATFLLTVFRDLTEGIVVGFALGAMLFIGRMARSTGVERHSSLAAPDQPDANGERQPYDPAEIRDPDVEVFRITGAFFFGAASAIGAVLDSAIDQRKALVLDFADVPFLDSTAANTIAGTAAKARDKAISLTITGASPEVRKALQVHGVTSPLVQYRADIHEAVAEIKANAKAKVEPL